MNIRLIFSLLLGGLLAFPVHANDAATATPVLYSRGEIKILPASKNTGLMPWQPAQGVTIRVDIRNASLAAIDDGWFNFITLGDGQGLLVTYDSPVVPEVAYANQYQPFDILLLNTQGIITQIFPSLVLAELEDTIVADEPAIAILYLKGGACETLGIVPGDRVQHAMFKLPPKVLTRTSQPNAKENSRP